MDDRAGQTAVIFVSQRTDADADGYDRAAQAMAALAARQPGYRGMDSVRGADGHGITVSYWADEASALAWRDHPEHVPIRGERSEEHTSELQSQMRITYAVFCLKKKK